MYLVGVSPKNVTVAPLSFTPLPANPPVASLLAPAFPQPVPVPSISPLEPALSPAPPMPGVLPSPPSPPLPKSPFITFILDGTYSQGATAIRAGAFAAGSKLTIIMVNGFDGQANGGDGGNGDIPIFVDPVYIYTTPPSDGTDGGIVYDAQGVDTDIYFSGATTSVTYPVADGYIRAPSGGDGGFTHIINGDLGDGGDGGDGRSAGIGGVGENAGSNGEIDGTGSGWGNAGDNNDATGGLAGSGVKDNGATVVFFGDTPTRYINGNGDH